MRPSRLLNPHRIVLACLLLAAVKAYALPAWIAEASKADTSSLGATATAIVLLESETVQYLAPDRVRTKTRQVVRLLKENGRRHTIVSLNYNPNTDQIRDARAWVVSANGKKDEIYTRNRFMDNAASFSNFVWDARRTVTLNVSSTVEIGGVIASEFEVERQSGVFDSSWSFVSSLPVARSRFEVVPMPDGKLLWHALHGSIPPPTPGDVPGSLRWEVLRVEPLPEERPTAFLPNPRFVHVRCFPKTEAAEQSHTWENFAHIVAAVIEPRIVADSEVRALAARLTAGMGDRWKRIRAITEFVQRDVPYFSLMLDRDSFAGYRPHLPTEVLKRRLGDCKDKATLAAALLRSLGESAHVMLVYAGNPSMLSPEWPSASFNHAIVAIAAGDNAPNDWPVVDGKDLGPLVLFDATDPYTPLGVLPAVDQGGYGLIAAHNGPGLLRLPTEPPTRNRLLRRIAAELDAAGDVSLKVEEIFSGHAAAKLYSGRAIDGQELFMRGLESSLGETLSAITGLRWDDQWTADPAEYRLNRSFIAIRHGRWVGRDMMLIRPQFLTSHEALKPWQIEHDGIVWLPPRCLREETRLQLPKGFAVAEVPRDWTHKTPLVSCDLRYRLENGVLVCESEITQHASALTRAEYDKLRAAYRSLEEAERRPLVLKREKPASTATPP